MHALNGTAFMDRLGAIVVNGALLAALPTAFVAILVQLF